jgi:carbamate kinase
MRIVAALGGNALLRRGQQPTEANQRANVKVAATALAGLIGAGHQLVVTHGNGPQVGLLALQSAAGPTGGAQPLDVLDAESEGMIGYLIEQELSTRLPGRQFATLLTQVRVAADDAAFAAPTKPIGPIHAEADARRLAAACGWSVAADASGWRRVVASPAPLEILEGSVIGLLARQGMTVICAGGGGIPVIRRADGSLAGVEAVIDKDASSALLAIQLEADMLMLLTDVEAVFAGFGTPGQHAIRQATPDDLDPQDFPPGSMRPKIEAATRFVRATNRPAAIGRLREAVQLLSGGAGTRIEPAIGQN